MHVAILKILFKLSRHERIKTNSLTGIRQTSGWLYNYSRHCYGGPRLPTRDAGRSAWCLTHAAAGTSNLDLPSPTTTSCAATAILTGIQTHFWAQFECKRPTPIQNTYDPRILKKAPRVCLEEHTVLNKAPRLSMERIQ